MEHPYLGLEPAGRADGLCNVPHLVRQQFPDGRVERPHGALEHGAIGDHVVRRARLDGADGNHRGLVGRHAPGDDRLQGGNDLGQACDRIEALVGPRTVRPPAPKLDLEAVCGGAHGAGLDHRLPDLEGQVDMGAEDRPNLVQDAGRQDRRRALAALLRRLQHEQNVACRRFGLEQARRGDRPGGMDVVAAGVHHALVARRERQTGVFLDRQRVDVTAHRDQRRLPVATGYPSDHTGAGHAGYALDAEFVQRPLKTGTRTLLLEREFGIGVERSP